jgi:hypothetical protein
MREEKRSKLVSRAGVTWRGQYRLEAERASIFIIVNRPRSVLRRTVWLLPVVQG